MYLGDFAVGTTFDFCFTTRRFTTGAPFTLAGTPSLEAIEDNSTTQITAGLTLTEDFDAVTGRNHVRVVASGANGYEAGKSYSICIAAGTVDSVSVVGEVVGYFTLERDATFARVGAPAGASVSADMAAVKSDTAAILADTGTDGVVVAAASKTGYALSAAGIQAIWDALTTALTTASSIGKLLVDNINATISSRATQTSVDTIDDFLDTEIAAILAAVDTEVADILADTGTDGVVVAAASKTGYALSAAGVDAIWDEAMSGHTTAGTYGDRLRAHLSAMLKAITSGTPTTTAIQLDATTGIDGGAPNANNDFYNGRVIIFLTGNAAGQATDITDYVGATTTLTVTALAVAPAAADTAVIV